MLNPDFKLSTAIINLLQVHYEGGLEQFNEDGGSIAVIPVEKDKLGVLVFHPEGLKEEIKNTLDAITQKDNNVKILYPTVANFRGMEIEAIEELINKELRDKVLELNLACIPQLNPAIALFTVLNKGIEDEAIKEFSETLRNTQGLYRGCISCKDGSIFIDQSPAQMLTVFQRPDRDLVIGDDDILNIRILNGLELDVEEYIKALG